MPSALSPVRLNQTGYAAGLPVQVAVTSDGPLRLTDAGGDVLGELSREETPVDPASGDRVRLINLGLLPPGTPLAKCFLDETPSADTNEIAIYWNFPAVFAAARFNIPREN